MNSVELLDHTPETVAILGAGPAGISCALWLKNLGHRPVILESGSKPGGTPGKIDRPNRWIAGMPEITSDELADQLHEQCSVSDLEVLTNTHSISITTEKPHRFNISLYSSEEKCEIDVAAIVFATGTKPRGIEALNAVVPDSLLDKIESDPLGHLTGGGIHEGERALIVGGADNAFFTANDLMSSGATVTLACRSMPKAQSLIQAQIKAGMESEKLQVFEATPDKFRKTETGIEVRLADDGDFQLREFDKVYLRMGFVPRLDDLTGILSQLNLPLNHNGFPELDEAGRWTDRGIYCCGDLNEREISAVVSALAGGARVAKTIEEDLRRFQR